MRDLNRLHGKARFQLFGGEGIIDIPYTDPKVSVLKYAGILEPFFSRLRCDCVAIKKNDTRK